AEIPVNADMHQRESPLKFRKNVGKKIEAGRFVRAKNYRALDDVATIRHYLDRFVAQTQQPLGKIEQNFPRRRQLHGFRGAIQKFRTIRLFQLAYLSADRGLRAENLLSCARKTL